MLEKGERTTTRRGDDLPAIGIDDRERPVLGNGFSKDRTEALLIGGDEGGSLGISIRIEYGVDQSLVGDLARCGEFAAL